MGRLAEWSRWRLHGLDRAAVFGGERLDHNREIAKRSKRRKWADELAEQVSSWEEIPGSESPMVIDTPEAELIIYRDGKKVVCVIGQKEHELARSTFEKRYLRRPANKRGQQPR